MRKTKRLRFSMIMNHDDVGDGVDDDDNEVNKEEDHAAHSG